MDGQPPTECTCGSSNFERVVVERRGLRPPYRTDFIACAECRLMYFAPEPPEPEPEPRAVTWTVQPKRPG